MFLLWVGGWVACSGWEQTDGHIDITVTGDKTRHLPKSTVLAATHRHTDRQTGGRRGGRVGGARVTHKQRERAHSRVKPGLSSAQK